MDTRSQALAHAEAAIAYEAQLEEELARVRPDRETIKALNAKIGTGLKLAEVYATLAVADAHRGPSAELRVDGTLTQEQADELRERFGYDVRLLAAGGVDYSRR